MSDELTMISIKDKAHELKTTRFINGRNFFRTIGCERFVTNFDYEETKKIWLIATQNGWMGVTRMDNTKIFGMNFQEILQKKQ